ncbi:MAG: 50S ribosomal protein L25 [Candidatus Komeilibacteria bacterium]|nr:50S ribosomal protein L25 [Candidatus Komeilibacteria bacterium]
MTDFKLKAEARAVPTANLPTVRKQGKIPAELYGQEQPNQHLFLNKLELEKVYRAAGENSLIDLIINAAPPLKAMIHNLDRDPVSGYVIHADLYQINMNKAVTVPVPVIFFGESKAVKDLGGTLVKLLNEVEISCLPGDLIHEIKVDLSVLENVGQSVKVADLAIPEKIKVLTPLDAPVVAVVTQQVEKAAPVAAVAAEVAPAAEAGKEAEGAKEADRAKLDETPKKAK